MARVPALSPTELAVETAIIVEGMITLITSRQAGQREQALSELRPLLERLRELPAHPSERDVHALYGLLLSLLVRKPELRSLKIAAQNLPLVESIVQHLNELEGREREGTITEEERAKIPTIRQALADLRSVIDDSLREFDLAGGA